MDLFSEYMVKAEKKPIDYLKIVLILVSAAVLSYFLFIITLMFIQIPIIPSLVFLCIFLIWYLAVFKLIRRYNVEYEYSITENELDVDKIMSRSARKRLLRVNVKTFEIIAPLKSSYYTENYKNTKTVFAASSDCSDRAYFAAFTDDGVKKVLVFEPNDKMLGIIERYTREKFHRN